jgi:hypothetical protein
MADQQNWVSVVMGGSHDEVGSISWEHAVAIVRDGRLRKGLNNFFNNGGVIPDIELRPSSDLTHDILTTLDLAKQNIIMEIVS